MIIVLYPANGAALFSSVFLPNVILAVPPTLNLKEIPEDIFNCLEGARSIRYEPPRLGGLPGNASIAGMGRD